MEQHNLPQKHFLLEGLIFVSKTEYEVTTILGSCISVCLWDPFLQIGGMNHYLLALWNGNGLATPRYGNIAIPKLIKKIMAFGCTKKNLRAKVFGGSNVLTASNNGVKGAGWSNIMFAEEMLKEEGIPIIASDLGGKYGRKIRFNTKDGVVMVKRFTTQVGKLS
jgi:chemotaxis protein CheD